MITISTLNAQINIDPNKEYVIYDVGYLADRFGRPLPEDSEDVKSGQFYEYGDIIIETERKRYTIPSVRSSHEWIIDIICCINSQKDTDNIVVDISELEDQSVGVYRQFDCGQILVETI